jgi:hypothetical protein
LAIEPQIFYSTEVEMKAKCESRKLIDLLQGISSDTGSIENVDIHPGRDVG